MTVPGDRDGHRRPAPGRGDPAVGPVLASSAITARCVPAWIAAVALGLSGCGSSPEITDIAECGSIRFPDNDRMIDRTGDQEFSGEAHMEMVAEFPATELDDFTSASQVGEFTEGVPSNWQKHYWQDSGVPDSLRAETNENFSDWDGSTGRQIVVHHLDADRVRVFTRGLC